jgi:mitochondrial fission protein ELM1
MNLIAINLGLAPIPALPPGIKKRAHTTDTDAEDVPTRSATGDRLHKRYGPEYRNRLFNMLRDTGCGTASDLAICMGTTTQAVRKHLERLERDGRVVRTARPSIGRTIYDWSVIEAHDA